MKRNNYDDKINKINSERIEMLKLIKEELTNSQNNINSSIDDIQLVLLYDKYAIDGYKTVLKTKKLINDLLEQISSSNNIDDIIKLRKKINNYINKIKKIIKERNIEDDILTNMVNNTTYLRKGMAKYVSYLKREKKLNEINKLNSSFQELNSENKNCLKKYLKNESKYNKRILKNASIKKDTIIEQTNAPIEKYNPYKEILEDEEYEEIEQNDNNNLIEEVNIDSSNKLDELQSNIQQYTRIYNLDNVLPYNDKKFITLLKNIPAYYRNKKIIKKMIVDYKYFMLNEDLLGYISYSKKRNSIVFAIEQLFNKSKLSEDEMKYLSDHSNCKEWINNYFYPNMENNVRLIKTI